MIDDIIKSTNAIKFHLDRILPELNTLTQEANRLAYDSLMEQQNNPSLNMVAVNQIVKYTNDSFSILNISVNTLLLYKGNLELLKQMEKEEDDKR